MVQYNTPEFDHNFGPYPYTMTSNPEEVTDEASKVEILAPANPVFNWPNKITEKDFGGWVEERGSKWMKSWDPQYQALIETHDEGQEPQKGGLLYAKYGKGHLHLQRARLLPAVAGRCSRRVPHLCQHDQPAQESAALTRVRRFVRIIPLPRRDYGALRSGVRALPSQRGGPISRVHRWVDPSGRRKPSLGPGNSSGVAKCAVGRVSQRAHVPCPIGARTHRRIRGGLPDRQWHQRTNLRRTGRALPSRIAALLVRDVPPGTSHRDSSPCHCSISTGPSRQTACSVTRAKSSSTMRTAGVWVSPSMQAAYRQSLASVVTAMVPRTCGGHRPRTSSIPPHSPERLATASASNATSRATRGF